MNKIFRQALLIFIGIIILSFFIQCNRNKMILYSLRLDAENLNSELPQQLGYIMRGDSCKVIPPRGLKIFITMNGMEADLFHKIKFDSIYKPTLSYDLQSNNGLHEFRENDITLMYVYYSIDGDSLGAITLTSDEYSRGSIRRRSGPNYFSMLSDEDLSLLLQGIASNKKKQLPMKAADIGTTLIDCSSHGKVFESVYSVDREVANKLDKRKDWGHTMKQLMIHDINMADSYGTLRTLETLDMLETLEMKEMLKAGIVFREIKISEDGDTICAFTISSEDIN